MHSRLYKRVLNKYDWIHNCTAFTSLYNDTGLAGIFVSAESSRATAAVDVICNELLVWTMSQATLSPILLRQLNAVCK